MNPREEDQKTIKMPSWLVLSLLCIFLAIIIVVLYLQFVRYALVAKSIDKGDSTTTALLLTPEITTGIARLF
ncbi:hypothetical protein QKU48_gp0737 [Fadolivirus algeromassiliense]|jgi:uncharacterized membrane protein|uniref:Uncharacterized protein n=1 Tax=Fadolivirus FV1/VV64 TaxID=3070911 RepID=A0A7D3V5L4_9VIRU|nr:hypothetical protein QKU48_gp0737 [Fadolivirus algeromassiliense]QKF94195.1 hypothetical protein Fadolivirus_1_737 [Fadolivirus FV1/VV64]